MDKEFRINISYDSDINTTYDAILEKLDEAVKQNIKLKKENNNLKRKNKYLQHIINKVKKETKEIGNKKYKNGRRGSKFNG